MNPCIFISYTHSDREFVEKLVDFLENKQIKCWFAPRDIPPGMVYPNVISSAIEKSMCFMIILSNKTVEAQFCAREVDAAVSCNKKILPVRIEDVEMRGQMQFYLRTVQWLNAFPNPCCHFNSIADAIRKIIPCNLPKAIRKSERKRVRLHLVEEIFKAKENIDVDIAEIIAREGIRQIIVNECIDSLAETVTDKMLSYLVNSVKKSPSTYNTKNKIDLHIKDAFEKSFKRVLRGRWFRRKTYRLAEILLKTSDFKLQYEKLWEKVGGNDMYDTNAAIILTEELLNDMQVDFSFDDNIGVLVSACISAIVATLGFGFIIAIIAGIFSMFALKADPNKIISDEDVLKVIEKYVERKSDIKKSILERLLEKGDGNFYDMLVNRISNSIKYVKLKELEAIEVLVNDEL